MDLSGSGGYFRWTGSAWGEILDLALEFGWVPAGTGPPRGVAKLDWFPGPYDSNEGQRVYARDAVGLANALDRALVEIPEREPPKRRRPGVRYLPPEQAASIRQFIDFCRAGSFRIF